MADKTITQLTATTSAASSDEIPIWVAGSAVTRKITKANFLQGAFTGGGTVATGGYTLTVPATGTAALRGVANTFTAAQKFQCAASVLPIDSNQNVAEAAAPGVRVSNNGNAAIDLYGWATVTQLALVRRDLGNNTAGPSLYVARNSSTGAVGPAAGTVRLEGAATNGYLWIDASSNLRIHTAAPTGSSGSPTVSDTAGTVVGTQTSMAAAKHLFDDVTPIGEVLANIQHAATAAVRRFTYRSGAFNGEAFEGVVTDLAPRYGMDRDEEHPAGKSLNEITLLGDLLRAVAHLAERVAALER